jgi:UDP-2-acetamido-2,6-beta-L-arabino-hexul-4-ose reductase
MILLNRCILVTGANGFIGKNLLVRLKELANITVSTFGRGDDAALLIQLVSQVDAIVHLAGENRPADEAAFTQVNSGLTSALCCAVMQAFLSTGRHLRRPSVTTPTDEASLRQKHLFRRLQMKQVTRA